MAATDLHASIMLNAIVLEGVMFTVPTQGIQPYGTFA